MCMSIIPFTRHQKKNFSVYNLAEPHLFFTLCIGVTSFTKLYLSPIDTLYFNVVKQLNENASFLDDVTMQLFDKPFAVQLLKRFGVKAFLETFIMHIVDALVLDVHYTGNYFIYFFHFL